MSWIVSPKVSKLAKKILSPTMAGEREDKEVPAKKYSLFDDFEDVTDGNNGLPQADRSVFD